MYPGYVDVGDHGLENGFQKALAVFKVEFLSDPVTKINQVIFYFTKSRGTVIPHYHIAGADFAEVAKKNSDCPSKENGGDLGVFSRGEMVKPFEDAAFSQDLNAVGPVIETEFGFHIIQVLEKNAPKVIGLDERMKTNISALLQQQKQQQAFETILKKLRAKSSIVVYKN